MESYENKTNGIKNNNLEPVETLHNDESINPIEEDIHVERKFDTNGIKRRQSNAELIDNEEPIKYKKKCNEAYGKQCTHHGSDTKLSNATNIMTKKTQAGLHNENNDSGVPSTDIDYQETSNYITREPLEKDSNTVTQEPNDSIKINCVHLRPNSSNTTSTEVLEDRKVDPVPTDYNGINTVDPELIILDATLPISTKSNGFHTISTNNSGTNVGDSKSTESLGVRGYNKASTVGSSSIRSPELTKSYPPITVVQSHNTTNATGIIPNRPHVSNCTSTEALCLEITSPTNSTTLDFNSSDISRSETPGTSCSFLHSPKNTDVGPIITNDSEIHRSETQGISSSILPNTNNTNVGPIIFSGSETRRSQTPVTITSFLPNTNSINAGPIISNSSDNYRLQSPATFSSALSSSNNTNESPIISSRPATSLPGSSSLPSTNNISTAPIISLFEEQNNYHTTANMGSASNEEMYDMNSSNTDAEIINIYANPNESGLEDPYDDEQPNQFIFDCVNPPEPSKHGQ